MIRVALGMVGLGVVLAVVWVLSSAGSRGLRPLLEKPRLEKRAISEGYEWERRTDQIYRRLKAVPGPLEDRAKILQFVESLRNVEAYVEPRTVIHPLSVVLVAEDGEWVRHHLKDDAFIRELARARRLKVFDATKVGYPERMRRYRRQSPDSPEGPAPLQGDT